MNLNYKNHNLIKSPQYTEEDHYICLKCNCCLYEYTHGYIKGVIQVVEFSANKTSAGWFINDYRFRNDFYHLTCEEIMIKNIIV